MNGVRIPKTPSSVPVVAIGLALAPIIYGFAVKGYKAARKQATERIGKYRQGKG